MIDLIDSTIEDLQSRKQSDFINHEKIVMKTITDFLPNKSKTLNTNLVKKLFSIEEELNLILVGHLYLEKLLNGILEENLNGFKLLEKKGILNSFYKKISFIKAEKITSDKILEDLLIINKLRNKYAHELNYDLAEFNIFELSFLKKYRYAFSIKRKSTIRILNRILVRQSFFYLLRRLVKEHRYLHLLDEE